MSEVSLTAIITPHPDKVDRLLEVLNEYAVWIRDNQPGTIRYQVSREVNNSTGATRVFVFEAYKSQADIKIHSEAAEHKQMMKTAGAEGLIAKPLELIFHTAVGGFESRL